MIKSKNHREDRGRLRVRPDVLIGARGRWLVPGLKRSSPPCCAFLFGGEGQGSTSSADGALASAFLHILEKAIVRPPFHHWVESLDHDRFALKAGNLGP